MVTKQPASNHSKEIRKSHFGIHVGELSAPAMKGYLPYSQKVFGRGSMFLHNLPVENCGRIGKKDCWC